MSITLKESFLKLRAQNTKYSFEILELKEENEKLKDAIKAELKRTGGCVPILNAVLKDCELNGSKYFVGSEKKANDD